MKRRSLLAGTAALVLVATGLAVTGVVGTAQPASAALGDVPADCSVFTTAYRSDGQRLTYEYSAQQTSTEALPGDNLGWVPTAFTGATGGGGEDSFESIDLATHPTDGWLYRVHRVGRLIDGAWQVTELTTTRIAPGFSGTRALAGGKYPYFFRLAGNSLYRFKLGSKDGLPTITTPVKLPGSDWNTVNTLKLRRTGGTADAPVHVLLGTKTNGQLREYRVDHATPATITSKILRPSGWEIFTSLNAGGCPSKPNGRPLLGITAAGRASVHFDANFTDGNGADIKGGTLGDLNWTEKAY
ncbi:hypothetical protein [Kribbella sp. DT2]|uniref:hypothetical protein n=1 Tax=Kribbella sp. DT2 TaxID=3393427 RepID=UPI003CFB2C55